MPKCLKLVPLALVVLLVTCARSARANELESLFHDSVVFTNVGFTSGGSVTVTNFPLKVTISEQRPYGFDYSLAGDLGSKIRFNYRCEYMSHGTNAVFDAMVNYTVTNWNVEGESVLYVKVPRFGVNPSAKLTMYWNLQAFKEAPVNDPWDVPLPLRNPACTAEWNQELIEQEADPGYLACGEGHRDGRLLNYWLTRPSITKTQWKQGDDPATIDNGLPVSPMPVYSVEYFDRSDNSSIGDVMPATPGAYRAVVTVATNATYAALSHALEFAIESGVHVGSVATPDDFACRVDFRMSGAAYYTNMVANLNTNRTAASASQLYSSYNYKSEIKSTGEVSLGCWFRIDPSVVNNTPDTSNADKMQLVSLCTASGSNGANARGPLAIAINNSSKTKGADLGLFAFGVSTNATGGYIYKELTAKAYVAGKPRWWTDGKWHFVMATRSKSTGVTVVYLDGEEYARGTTDPDSPIYNDSGTENSFSIGCDPSSRNAMGMAFIGRIAEVQVYNRALEPATIAALYTGRNRLSGYEDGLLGYFPLNDRTVAGKTGSFSVADTNLKAVKHAVTSSAIDWTEDEDFPLATKASTLEGMPIRVELANNRPVGFRYDRLYYGSTAEDFMSDARFFDSQGRVLDCEIESWNSSGTSYVWVKGVSAKSGSRLTLCWGQGGYTSLPANDPSKIWPEETTEDQRLRVKGLYVNGYSQLVTPSTVATKAIRFQNRWKVEPSLSITRWEPGDAPAVLEKGKGWDNTVPSVTWYDRATGQRIDAMPTVEVGEYRVVFRCEESEQWSALEKEICFRIFRPTYAHDLGDGNDRVLLANDDHSVSGGDVTAQSYDDDDPGWGSTYWRHHEGGADVVASYDPTVVSSAYNLFMGDSHEFMNDQGERLWGLEHVRFGNLFNNGRWNPSEQGLDGLRADQNYLPWNPGSQRMLAYHELPVGSFHRYAGTFLLQNVFDERLGKIAQICSRCYDEGIGTIYFDVVNAFTNNVFGEDGEPNYAIVVEVATNVVGYADVPPADELIIDGADTDHDGEYDEIYDYYANADWHPVEMQVIRFHGDSGTVEDDCDFLGATNELALTVTRGGGVTDFYRVYVPLNIRGKARFRIRRTAIDPDYSLNPDGNAYIILDNLVCSRPCEMLRFEPYGRLDPDKCGKRRLGQGGAFEPAFPGPKDAITARVKAFRNQTGSAVPDPGDVTAVTMHYRWHYLEQQSSGWQIVDLDPATLRARSPLMLPGMTGDIDFWFEGSQNSGYYCYANYSGMKLGVPHYTEKFDSVTNGWDGTSAQWSVRIRDGRSDYEEASLFVRRVGYGDIEEIPMYISDAHQWRTFYSTTNDTDGVDVRVEFRNRQESGDGEWRWTTNDYCIAGHGAAAPLVLPYNGKISACGTNDWTRVPVSKTTGYILFQANDSGYGLSVMRADYQNFNRWSDAHREHFVGSAAAEADLPTSGASPLSRIFVRDYRDAFDSITIPTNRLWNLNFEESSRSYDYHKTYPAREETVNGWLLGKGLFVRNAYDDPRTGTAFQLAGNGEGYVEMSDRNMDRWPGGIEKVTFTARLAQDIAFDDFTVRYDNSDLTNYTFCARGVFDLDGNNGFTGNASLSLVAYYLPKRGCYELRWEQITGQVADGSKVIYGADPRGQRLSLYRWNRSGNSYTATRLFCATNTWGGMPVCNAGITTLTGMGRFMPMALSVQNTGEGTKVTFAVHLTGISDTALLPTSGWRLKDGSRNFEYIDTDEARLTSGTYGVLTANSDGHLVTPMLSTNYFVSATFSPTSDKFESCKQDVIDGKWGDVPGRDDAIKSPTAGFYKGIYGFKASDVYQTLELQMAKPSEGVYRCVKSFSISNNWGRIRNKSVEEFGAELPLLWRTENALLRIRTTGDLDRDVRTDVVLDNVSVRQWRGKNEIVLYDDADNPDEEIDSRRAVNGDPANFVYTSGWIGEGNDGRTSVELSARRTLPGRPASVRTPLMDGLDGRGDGIGNLIFTYRDLQPNTILLVQLATNVNRSALEQLTCDVTTSDEPGKWRTVARLSYDVLGSAGSTNIAFGVRNCGDGGAVARLIVDPALVESVTNNVSPSRFGSVKILDVSCQDEPRIDRGCWWGWNLRTLGDRNDNEYRMYLPDPDERYQEGWSLALNDSVTADIDPAKADEYSQFMPFLQTPSFTNSDVIGEISFRARKYSTSEASQCAELQLYGITAAKLAQTGGRKLADWTPLTRFDIDSSVFSTYSYRVDSESKYCAFRLGITGVKGVNPIERGPSPTYGADPVRVLLDEVVVSEAVYPELSIRGVAFFRSDMGGKGEIPGLPCKEEQPLCGEGWGVQCELYALTLGDQIDQSTPPQVRLYWYEGDENWGFDRWRNDTANVHSAWLARATGTDALMYRSSYETAPDAVIPSSEKKPGANPPVIQFMLEVYYTTVDPKTGITAPKKQLLKIENEEEWQVPSWYAPLDYNTDPEHGNSEHWSCFCVLDDLAPGWAWINEVNINNLDPVILENDDDNCQFVEIAAPVTTDLTGWRVEMLESQEYRGTVLTNVIATFGEDGLSGTKSLLSTSNYVFHVIGNPAHSGNAHSRAILDGAGRLDGTWTFGNYLNSDAFDKDGYLDWATPIGIRLVRPNGIVEHEVVTVGTNIIVSAGLSMYSPTGVVAYLNQMTKPDAFFYPGQDCGRGDFSVGVVNERGNPGPYNWKNTMKRTPGQINEGQQIDPDFPVPYGEMIFVTADLDQSGGRIEQSIDGHSFTNESQRFYMRKGSTIGTNIIYRVEPWYEVAFARQECGDRIVWLDVSNGFNRVTHTVSVNVGRGCSNRVTVVAGACPDRRLRDLGCDEKNIYTPAVVDWLQKGETLRGPFQGDDEIKLAEFWGIHSGFEGYLTLTEMYWLDIDPTAGDMVLKAGMSKAPEESLAPIYDGYSGPAFVTNLKMSVFMMITNKTDNPLSPYYHDAWSPYVLRAVKPGDCSTNYVAGSGNVWTSETFKISGILPNGHTSELNRDNWVDLRWFIFTPDSFHQPGNSVGAEPFTTDIEIIDPVNSTESPAFGAGWYDWVHDPAHPEHASIRPFFRWGLDTRLRPFEVEVLKTNNYYTVAEP